MKFLDNNKNISELSIPGTHDTMANYELTHMVRTQAVSLMGQLESGIRFLDIRCNYTNEGILNINHGFINLKYNLDDVLKIVTQFLDENPTESVFMRIKQEHSSKDDYTFDQKLKEYVSRYSNYFWEDSHRNPNPKLGEVRGKIVVFNDIFGSTVGLDYRTSKKQDNYTLETNWSLYDKWLSIKNFLTETRNGDINTIYINYLSGSGGSFPYFVASGQSSPEMSAPRLSTGLAGPAFSHYYPDFPRGNVNDILFEGTNILTTSNILNNPGRVGIIVADFPGKGLIDSIISKNDFSEKNYISVGGVNYNGNKEVEAFRVNFNLLYNEIYLTNRLNDSIHAGFRNNKYFSLRLLDKNLNEKSSINLNGNDNPSDSKYDKLNFTQFEIGDIIEVEHEENFRLNINGKISKNKKESYKITNKGLEHIDQINNSYIRISGSGGGSFDLLFQDNLMKVTNIVKGYFASEYTGFNNYYIEVTLSAKNGKEKARVGLYGSMHSTTIFLNDLNNVKFENGDILTIGHMSPKYINVRVPIIGNRPTGSKQKYEITNLGFKVIE